MGRDDSNSAQLMDGSAAKLEMTFRMAAPAQRIVPVLCRCPLSRLAVTQVAAYFIPVSRFSTFPPTRPVVISVPSMSETSFVWRHFRRLNEEERNELKGVKPADE